MSEEEKGGKGGRDGGKKGRSVEWREGGRDGGLTSVTLWAARHFSTLSFSPCNEV